MRLIVPIMVNYHIPNQIRNHCYENLNYETQLITKNLLKIIQISLFTYILANVMVISSITSFFRQEKKNQLR